LYCCIGVPGYFSNELFITLISPKFLNNSPNNKEVSDSNIFNFEIFFRLINIILLEIAQFSNFYLTEDRPDDIGGIAECQNIEIGIE